MIKYLDLILDITFLLRTNDYSPMFIQFSPLAIKYLYGHHAQPSENNAIFLIGDSLKCNVLCS